MKFYGLEMYNEIDVLPCLPGQLFQTGILEFQHCVISQLGGKQRCEAT